jgi:hypothetical protein
MFRWNVLPTSLGSQKAKFKIEAAYSSKKAVTSYQSALKKANLLLLVSEDRDLRLL